MALFDHRWDGQAERSLMSVCLPSTKTLTLFSLAAGEDDMLKVTPLAQLPAISATSIRATRGNVWDLLVVKPDHHLTVLTHGTRELPIELRPQNSMTPHNGTVMDVDANILHPSIDHGRVVSVQNGAFSSATLVFEDGWKARTSIDLVPRDTLTNQSLQILALTLPAETSFALHRTFLEKWSSSYLRTSDGTEFDCFTAALFNVLGLEEASIISPSIHDHVWTALAKSSSHGRFREDPVLKHLTTPSYPKPSLSLKYLHKPHNLLAPVLYALHTLGEDLRLMVHRYDCLLKLVPVISRIALSIRPEWADYWKRLCPDPAIAWPSPATTGELALEYLNRQR